jgi:hypothetical protein
MCEMVQTERDYVQSLQFIIENYIPELQRELIMKLVNFLDVSKNDISLSS